MMHLSLKRAFLLCFSLITGVQMVFSQTASRPGFKEPKVFAGIEVGSKGVKMSIVEMSSGGQQNQSLRILKDSAVNTDFISFTPASFLATLKGLTGLYSEAMIQYSIPGEKIFTVISSGVHIQAEKSGQLNMLKSLADSFRSAINDPGKVVDIVNVKQEAMLSHLGIVPEFKRFNTFLIDIGSGNTKGGFFPDDNNLQQFKLFQLTWGTRSVANAVEKKLEGDQSIDNYRKQLYRVLAGSAADEIIYAVNASDAYNINDNIVFSGGIAWSVATLINPELIENPVIPVTYAEVENFYNQIYENYHSFSAGAISSRMNDPYLDKQQIATEVARVHKVFEQKSLLAGTGLLLKVMRQFEGIYEKKDFYLVKNGQVGWISAYVKQAVSKQ